MVLSYVWAFFHGTKTFSKVAPHLFSELSSVAAFYVHTMASELDGLLTPIVPEDVILSFVTVSCYVSWRHVMLKQQIFCANIKD